MRHPVMHGIVRDGVVVPDRPLPEGTLVTIMMPSAFTPEEQAEFDEWEQLGDEARAMIDEWEREEQGRPVS